MSASYQDSLASSTDGLEAILRSAEFRAVTDIAGKHRPTIVIAGRAGVGKSSIVNSLVGRAVVPVGGYKPTPSLVDNFLVDLEGLPLNIAVSPGLCEDEGRDEEVVAVMRNSIKEVHSLWYVTRLDETRVRSDEKRAIQLVSQAFQDEDRGNGKVWRSAVVVFTFAGQVPQDMFSEALSRRTELIRREIALHAGPEIAGRVTSVAVENRAEATPDGKPWRSVLVANALLCLMREVAVTSRDQPVAPTADTSRIGEPAEPDSITQPPAPEAAPAPDNSLRTRRYEELGRKVGGKFGAAVGRAIGRVATWVFGN
jgi:hypothetical protein